MPSRVPTSVLSLLLLSGVAVACVRKEPQSKGDEEIEVDPIPLETPRLLAHREIEGSLAPVRVAILPSRNLSFVLDTQAGRVHVLDPFFRHDGRSRCVDATGWEPWADQDPGYRGRCQQGEIELHRGYLTPDTPPAAMAVDHTNLGLWILDTAGALWWAGADALVENPFDYLALRRVGLAPSLKDPSTTLLAAHEGLLYLLDGSALHQYDPDSEQDIVLDLPSTGRALALVGAEPWVATDLGMWTPETFTPLDSAPRHLVPDESGGLWATRVESAEVLHFENAGSVPLRATVDSLTGPIAWDAQSERLGLAISDGLWVGEAQGASLVELARIEAPAALELVATGNRELVLLGADGSLELFSDEESLAEGSPLSVFIAAFMERPRSESDDAPCGVEGREGACLRTFMETAVLNRSFLDDLPATIALGLTPWMVHRSVECGLREDLGRLWQASRTEAGVLFHDVPEECVGDTSCYERALDDDLSMLAEADVVTTWASGMANHGEAGFDWVQALTSMSITERYLFFGTSILPEIDGTDPRAKDPYPLDASEISAAWRVSSGEEIHPGDPLGEITVYPGNNIPGYNLGYCAGLFLMECHRADAGGGSVFKPQDIEVLDISLHRALAHRGDSPSSWYFHLPDLGLYDYTAGCVHQDGRWEGETCQAQLLQEWIDDVNARFAANGLMEWSLPSLLEAP